MKERCLLYMSVLQRYGFCKLINSFVKDLKVNGWSHYDLFSVNSNSSITKVKFLLWLWDFIDGWSNRIEILGFRLLGQRLCIIIYQHFYLASLNMPKLSMDLEGILKKMDEFRCTVVLDNCLIWRFVIGQFWF